MYTTYYLEILIFIPVHFLQHWLTFLRLFFEKRIRILCFIEKRVHEIRLWFYDFLPGVRILAGHVTDLLEAYAVLHQHRLADVISNSWGPSDNGKKMEMPHYYTAKAIKVAATKVGSTLIFSHRDRFGPELTWVISVASFSWMFLGKIPENLMPILNCCRKASEVNILATVCVFGVQ